jgi:hypothetical protein
MWKYEPFKTTDSYAIERVEARSRIKADNVGVAYVANHVASNPCLGVGSALPMLGDIAFIRGPA